MDRPLSSGDIESPSGIPREVAVCVASGALMGVALRLGDGGPGIVAWIANIAAPWLFVAWGIGARAPTHRAAVRRSLVVLAGAVLAKYAVQVAQHDIGLRTAAYRSMAWTAAAVVVSAVVASIGHVARRAAWPYAAITGLLALEATAFLTRLIRGESAELRYHGQTAGRVVFLLEIVAAVLVGVVGLVSATRRRRRG